MGRKLVLGGVGVLLVLVLLLGALARRYRALTQALTASADYQMAIVQGECQRAYDFHAAAFRAEMSRERFESVCQQAKAAFGGASYTCEVLEAGEQEAELSCAARRDDREIARLNYTLIREDTRWRVRRFRVAPAPR